MVTPAAGDDGDGQQGGEPHFDKALHHDLAGRIDAAAQKRHAEQPRRNRKAEQRRQQIMRLARKPLPRHVSHR